MDPSDQNPPIAPPTRAPSRRLPLLETLSFSLAMLSVWLLMLESQLAPPSPPPREPSPRPREPPRAPPSSLLLFLSLSQAPATAPPPPPLAPPSSLLVFLLPLQAPATAPPPPPPSSLLVFLLPSQAPATEPPPPPLAPPSSLLVFLSPSPSPSPQRPPPNQGSGFLSVLFSFVAIALLILILSISSIKSSLSILHQVPEGHVGVYWRGGALLNTITNPGFHLKMPLVTQHEAVQVTPQTDQVRDIPCGTKGGVMINFEKIEVVYRLHKDYVYETLLNYGVQYDHMWIYEKIHHEINKFCSSHSLQQVYIDVFDQIDEKMKGALQCDCTRYAPGIEIISVHVTKPTIPDSIRRNFEQLEEERIKVLIAIEKQKIAEKGADTMKKMAISGAEKMASVNEKDSARKQQEIEDQIITWLVRRVWQMLKENQILCTRLMSRVWQLLRGV